MRVKLKRMVLVVGFRLMFISILLTSCSKVDLATRLENKLKNNDSYIVYNTLKYPKLVSKKLFDNRFKPLVEHGLLAFDSVSDNLQMKFKISPTRKSRHLLLSESASELIFIGESLKFSSIDTIRYSSIDDTFSIVEANYKQTFISDLFKMDPYTISDNAINSKTMVQYEVKHTLFGLEIGIAGLSSHVLIKD